MRRRLIIAAVLVLLLTIGTSLAWHLADMPPLSFVLRYGYPSPTGPTGRTETVEGVEFVEISAGYFRMGSETSCDEGDLLGLACAAVGLSWGEQPRHRGHMCPVHWVEFPNGFWVARTELTNEQYERFDPGHGRRGYSVGDRHPVVDVSWEDAKRYCAWLGEKAGRPVRLPTEAEWECACTAGSDGEAIAVGDESVSAWFGTGCLSGSCEVASGPANRWGLFDLEGNVAELCEDAWHDSYVGAPTDGSSWVDEDSVGYVYRCGCPEQIRPPPIRYFQFSADGCGDLGFRPAFTLPPED